MPTTKLLISLAASIAFAACGGGDDNAQPDAAGGRDSGATADAGSQPDANASGCDYSEAADATNNLFEESGMQESTGLSVDGANPLVFCGTIDPAQATADVADADFFEFTVPTSDNFRVELTAVGGADLTNFSIGLYADQGAPVTFGRFNVSHGVASIDGLAAGTYIVATFADLPEPTVQVAYRIRVLASPPTCPADSNAATYTEADESAAAHRANDMVSVAFDRNPAGQPTASATDAPEPTAVVVSPATRYHLQGSTAMVSSDGDEYLDRDTFAIASDASTNEVSIRLNWPDGNSDLDVFLFADGDPAFEYASGTIIGTTADEVITTAIPSGATFWLWVGTYDDTDTGGNTNLPLTYDLTICGNSFTP